MQRGDVLGLIRVFFPLPTSILVGQRLRVHKSSPLRVFPFCLERLPPPPSLPHSVQRMQTQQPGRAGRDRGEGALYYLRRWRWCVCVKHLRCDSLEIHPGTTPPPPPLLHRVDYEKQKKQRGRLFTLQVVQRKLMVGGGRYWMSLQKMCVCVYVCVCVYMWLVQVIVHRGEGAGADASSSHDGEALGGLTHSLGQGGLLGEVVSL